MFADLFCLKTPSIGAFLSVAADDYADLIFLVDEKGTSIHEDFEGV